MPFCENPGTGLMDYNARFYDVGLGKLFQPDTIVPQPGNPQSWNRYSYVGNNPVNFIDPSGNKACLNELDGDGCEVDPDWQKEKGINDLNEVNHSEISETTKPANSSQQSSSDLACSGSNWSIVCNDPTLVSGGYIQTNRGYPINELPQIYDGPYIDAGCASGLLCALLLGEDAAHYGTYQTNINARLVDEYVQAGFQYVVRRNLWGYTNTFINAIDIQNHTSSPVLFKIHSYR